jgi:hypothetical protein
LRDERRHDSLRRESDAIAFAIADTFAIAETVGPDSATVLERLHEHEVLNAPRRRRSTLTMGRFFRSVAPLIAVATLASCAAHATQYPTCDLAFEYPIVRLVYPISGTGGVAPRRAIVIYASFANGQPGPLSVPIALQVDSRTQAQVQTTPTALPSPLPSPAATPSSGLAQLFAVGVPRLDPDRTYDVLATTHFGGCGPPGTGQTKIGTFRTR